VLLTSFGPLGAAQVRIRVTPSAAGSLVHMEERPSAALGGLHAACLLDLVIQARNAESLGP
jgi:hypothetical protein